MKKILKPSTATENLSQDQIKDIIEYMMNNKPVVEKIALPTLNGFTFFNEEDILYFEGNGNLAYVVMTDENKIPILTGLKDIENRLVNSKSFYRVHRSYIINLNRVLKINKNSYWKVEMENNLEIEISRRRKNEFCELVNLN